MIIRILNAVEGAKDVRDGEQYTVYSVHLVDVEVPPGVMDCPDISRSSSLFTLEVKHMLNDQRMLMYGRGRRHSRSRRHCTHL